MTIIESTCLTISNQALSLLLSMITDHNVESLHGFAMHAINEIVIQRASIMGSKESVQSEPSTLRREKRHSFKPICSEWTPYIKSKNKDNPATVEDADKNSKQLECYSFQSRRQSVASQSLEACLPKSSFWGAENAIMEKFLSPRFSSKQFVMLHH